MPQAKKKVQTISQFDLERVYHLNQRLEKAKELVEKEKIKAEAANDTLLELIKAGVQCEEGKRIVVLKTQKGRRTPAYKQYLIKLKGEKYVDDIIENTKPSEDKDYVEVL